MRHNNYYEVQAESYFDLGVQLGEMFQDYLHASLFWLQKEELILSFLLGLLLMHANARIENFSAYIGI